MDSFPHPYDPNAFDVIHEQGHAVDVPPHIADLMPWLASPKRTPEEVAVLDAKLRPFPSTPVQKVMDKILVFPEGWRSVDAICALRAIDSLL